MIHYYYYYYCYNVIIADYNNCHHYYYEMLIKDVKLYLYVGVLNDVLHLRSVMRIF